ncbi:isocitrate dehydrogenase [Candidatus Mesenet endosymbiont of Agriotes lineatus]|uniref:isocitrate dehydrogenase n=1 Tax=Candidatus Mesenet endosymbiont of Agriotes lineatus TaxID=3077948 RepID=UPI0030CEB332
MSVPITVAYGNGIGPEIMEAVLSILKEAKADVSIESIELGGRLYEKEWEAGISDSSWESIGRTKILLKSPTTTPQGKGHKSLNVALRKRLGLYANIRPCISYHPVIETKFNYFNIVVVRENEEDVYAGVEHRLTEDTYQCTKIITKSASQRICNYAFEYALKNNRKKVTCLIKDNIMKMTDGVFHEAFREVAEDYKAIQADHYLVDIGMAKVATNPEAFDIIVTENLYGDILSDVVAQISGSVGLAGSANIGDEYAMFEAVHGSAPDIAGKNIANPSGLLNAVVQMLIHIGQVEIAQLISNAWLKTLEDGIHTADLYKKGKSSKKVGTTEFAQSVIDNLGQKPKLLPEFLVSKNIQTNREIFPLEESIKQSIRKLVGVDISIRWDNSANLNKLTDLFLKESSKVNLTTIYSKGLIVWPQSSKFVGDQITCRFYANQNSDINELLVTLEKEDLDVVKLEKLYYFDDKPGFFC